MFNNDALEMLLDAMESSGFVEMLLYQLLIVVFARLAVNGRLGCKHVHRVLCWMIFKFSRTSLSCFAI